MSTKQLLVSVNQYNKFMLVIDHRSELLFKQKTRCYGNPNPKLACCHMILGPEKQQTKQHKVNLDLCLTQMCSHSYTVSLENVLCDVKELQRGMELTWREFSVQHNSTLKDFISRNESRLNKLQEDARIAKVILYVF